MPAQVTTRAQVNGYRFLIRRLEHALIRADSRMIHDPMRGQIRSLLVGLVIAILITGAAGVLAFFKPSPNIGNAQILLSTSNGGLYVRIGDRLHPVLNLASARLITGKADAPKSVSDKWLNQLPRGPDGRNHRRAQQHSRRCGHAYVGVDRVRHGSNPRRVQERRVGQRAYHGHRG